jgi:subtilisin family serine protease
MKIHLLQFAAIIVCLALFASLQNVQPDVILAANQLKEQGSIPASVMGKIDPLVLSEIDSQDFSDFFLLLVEQADLSANKQLATKLEKGEYVFETLKNFAEQSQRDLRAFLDAQGVDYRPFYIANTILVRAGSRDLLMDIAARPDIEAILPNRSYQLQEPFIDDPDPPETMAVEPNITFIRATDVWAMGITGEGAVLAGADTGLQWDHPAIKEHYRGWDGANADHNYNWWDATGEYPMIPTDGHGHGTHTSGILVGDDGGTNQIGVAPGAKTIHCKLLTDSGYSNDEIIMECFAWILAPWDLNGEDPMPSMAPDAMNNSWGYTGGGDPVFEAIISNLNAAGILVEASAGGSGPSCATLASPGDYLQVLTTGSVNHLGGELPGILSPFSSRGPSMLYPDAFKPNILAPGHNIRSSLPGDTYASWSGTSMAGPHATALVGLMWSACPTYQGFVEETFEIIHNTAVPLTGQGGSNCGGDYVEGPNNDWGYGTIDALAAVNEILSLCGPQGYLEGIVNDVDTGEPIMGAIVTADWQDGGSWEQITDEDGYYLFEIPAGLYDVTAEHPQYTSQTVTDVEVL